MFFTLVINYLQKGKTITKECYCNLLTELDPIHQNQTLLEEEKKYLLAPGYKSVWAIRKCKDLNYEAFENAPYSSGLATSYFYLFPKLKIFLLEKVFHS